MAYILWSMHTASRMIGWRCCENAFYIYVLLYPPKLISYRGGGFFKGYRGVVDVNAYTCTYYQLHLWELMYNLTGIELLIVMLIASLVCFVMYTTSPPQACFQLVCLHPLFPQLLRGAAQCCSEDYLVLCHRDPAHHTPRPHRPHERLWVPGLW